MLLSKKWLFLGFILINACGFKPLYRYQNNDAGININLARTYIAPIEGRLGQLVRNNLKDRINTYGTPKNFSYRLYVKIKEPVVNKSISIDNTATRETIVFNASYELMKDDDIIIEGESKAESSFSILTMPYGTVVSKEDALRRAAILLADDIVLRLSVYFKDID